MKLRLAALLAALAASPARPADFTLVTVGDLILSRPLSMLRHPGAFPDSKGFADTLSLLSQGDATYGNLETTILDIRSFTGAPYSWDGDWMLSSVPAVAQDLKAMGFGLVSRANNHALDWGVDGMRQTASWLPKEIAAAGAGDTLAKAAAPALFESAKGKVAIVSMASTFRPTTNALAESGAAPYGRPGVDGLNVTVSSLLPGADYKLAAEIACSFLPPSQCPRDPASVDLFGTTIREAKTDQAPFTYDYALDQADLARVSASVRQAGSSARYVIATIHAHEALSDEAPPSTWQDPASFLKPLAHQLIENGADAFVATGIHHVAGIEIYRGKPIFYGHANFFWSDMQEPLASELYGSLSNAALLDRSFVRPDRATDADLGNVMNANGSFRVGNDQPADLNRVFQTFVARSIYDDTTRQLRQIRLYPIDLGYGDKLTRSGVPRRAGRAVAERVLDRIIRLSPGVVIRKEIENGYLIGVATPQ